MLEHKDQAQSSEFHRVTPTCLKRVDPNTPPPIHQAVSARARELDLDFHFRDWSQAATKSPGHLVVHEPRSARRQEFFSTTCVLHQVILVEQSWTRSPEKHRRALMVGHPRASQPEMTDEIQVDYLRNPKTRAGRHHLQIQPPNCLN